MGQVGYEKSVYDVFVLPGYLFFTVLSLFYRVVFVLPGCLCFTGLSLFDRVVVVLPGCFCFTGLYSLAGMWVTVAVCMLPLL